MDEQTLVRWMDTPIRDHEAIKMKLITEEGQTMPNEKCQPSYDDYRQGWVSGWAAASEVSTELVTVLRDAGDKYGAMGVALAAARMTNVDALVQRLCGPEDSPTEQDEPLGHPARYRYGQGTQWN